MDRTGRSPDDLDITMGEETDVTLSEKEITNLVFKKNGSAAVELWLDGEKFMICHLDLVLTFHLDKGMKLSAETLTSLIKAQKVIEAWQDALRFVHVRSRSRLEIERRLIQKGHDPEVIKGTILRLSRDYGINDAVFAQDYFERHRDNMGTRRLKQELSRLGISRDIIDEVLSKEDPESRFDSELENALEIARRKALQSEGVDVRKIGLRVAGLLERKGYDMNVIRRVLDLLELKLY